MAAQKPQDCRHWDSCSAPLCPLDLQSMEHGIWYPDEEICRSRTHRQGLKWIENQRKIAKKAKSTDTYFTVEMLDRDFIVRSGIEGIDPDSKNPEKEYKQWFVSHPEQSAEQKQKKQQQAQNNFQKASNE